MDPIEDQEDSGNINLMDINKLKDDFYVDILAKTPPLESNSIISNEGMDLYDELKIPKKPVSDKLNELIIQRDQLIQQDSPDEDILKQLNHDIRNMLINCGT